MTTAQASISPTSQPGWRKLVKPEFGIIPVLVLVIVIGAILSPAFLSTDNMFGIVQQTAELSILVMGLTLVLLVGKFDLSLESIFGLAPMVGAFLFLTLPNSTTLGLLNSPFVALLGMFAAGALAGAVNGVLVVYLKFNAFIATLATLILMRGIAVGISKGETLSSLPEPITWLGQAQLGGIPVSLIVALAVLGGLTWFLSRHRGGRAIYAIGGNAEAARVAGIRVERVTFFVFIAAAMLATLAGLLQVGRIQSIPASLGDGLIFNAFAAAVLGGVSLNGGKGTMLGACGGVLLLVLIQNVLILAQVPAYWIAASTGALILVALFIARLTGTEKS